MMSHWLPLTRPGSTNQIAAKYRPSTYSIVMLSPPVVPTAPTRPERAGDMHVPLVDAASRAIRHERWFGLGIRLHLAAPFRAALVVVAVGDAFGLVGSLELRRVRPASVDLFEPTLGIHVG